MKDLQRIHKQLNAKWNKLDWVFQNLTGSDTDAIETETKVGQDLARAIEEEQTIDSDASVASFLSEMGAYLASRVRDNKYRFRFQPILSRSCNALALPGGFIFVTRGLMEFCQWQQEEIAFIVGHEMGHVALHHARSKISGDLMMDAAALASPIKGVIESPLKHLFKNFSRGEYSKERELQADDFAVRLLYSAGFSLKAPHALFDRLSEKPDLVKKDDGFEFFRSHPRLPERIAAIERTRQELETAKGDH